jgi:hypothetical protein
MIMPSSQTLSFRSTRNQRGNCVPLLLATLPVRIVACSVLGVKELCPPSVPTLSFRSTRNQCGNSCRPCHLVLLPHPSTFSCLRLASVHRSPYVVQSHGRWGQGSVLRDIIPSTRTLTSRSIRKQCGNCEPLHRKYICTAYFSLRSSSSVHVVHVPVRPGTTSAAIVSQSTVSAALPLLAGIRNCSNQICIFFFWQCCPAAAVAPVRVSPWDFACVSVMTGPPATFSLL